MENLHGKVKIELYNSNTKIKEVIKGENTFQNAFVAKGLRNLGAANSCYLNNGPVRSKPLWHEIVGGILLFRDTIQEGTEYMPAGNKMIGNGSVDISNIGEPNEFGSFNQQESSATNGVITQVYDFTTNQANGQISCVSLTSRMGGFMGYGNPSGKAYPTTKIIQEGLDLQTVNPQETVDWRPRLCIGNMYYGFIWNSTAKTVTVEKYPVAITQASMFTGLVKSVTIDVSSLDYNYVIREGLQACCVSDGKCFLSNTGGRDIAPGAVFKYWVYDPSDDTIIEKTLTNTSNHYIYPRYFGMAYGKFFSKGSSIDGWYSISVFDAETSAHIGDYKTHSNPNADDSTRPVEFSGGLVQMGNGAGWSTSAPNNNYLLIYDPVNDTVYPTNCYGNQDYRFSGYYYDAITDTLGFQSRYNLIKQINPLYLATIYNLQSPVTKTAAQTMKVTYSLTEA